MHEWAKVSVQCTTLHVVTCDYIPVHKLTPPPPQKKKKMFVAKTVLVRQRQFLFASVGLERKRTRTVFAANILFCLKFVFMYVTTYSHNIQSTPDKMKVPGDSERLPLIRRRSSPNDAPDMGKIAHL